MAQRPQRDLLPSAGALSSRFISDALPLLVVATDWAGSPQRTACAMRPAIMNCARKTTIAFIDNT